MYAEASYITCVTVSEKQPAVLKRRKLSSNQWQQHNTELGQIGENRAAHFLISQNFQIIDRNACSKSGEIDIVALDKQTRELVFVEVKTRTHTHFGHASLAWNWKKIKNSYSIAHLYLKNRPDLRDLAYRFDLIVVLSTQLFHYKNVTE